MGKWEERYGNKYMSKMENKNAEEPVNIKIIKKRGEAETYHPCTMDEAWELAEGFAPLKKSVQRDASVECIGVHLLTIAKKQKTSASAEFVRFFDINGELVMESAIYGDTALQRATAYFIRDFKTGEIHFPKTTDEAWSLVKTLLPKDLVEKAMTIVAKGGLCLRI